MVIIYFFVLFESFLGMWPRKQISEHPQTKGTSGISKSSNFLGRLMYKRPEEEVPLPAIPTDDISDLYEDFSPVGKTKIIFSVDQDLNPLFKHKLNMGCSDKGKFLGKIACERGVGIHDKNLFNHGLICFILIYFGNLLKHARKTRMDLRKAIFDPSIGAQVFCENFHKKFQNPTVDQCTDLVTKNFLKTQLNEGWSRSHREVLNIALVVNSPKSLLEKDRRIIYDSLPNFDSSFSSQSSEVLLRTKSKNWKRHAIHRPASEYEDFSSVDSDPVYEYSRNVVVPQTSSVQREKLKRSSSYSSIKFHPHSHTQYEDYSEISSSNPDVSHSSIYSTSSDDISLPNTPPLPSTPIDSPQFSQPNLFSLRDTMYDQMEEDTRKYSSYFENEQIPSWKFHLVTYQ